MENTAKEIEHLFEKTKTYARTSVDYYKLQMVETASDLFSEFAVSGIMLTLVAVFTLFINIALGFYLGDILDSNALGFLIVSFIFLIACALLFVFKKKLIQDPVANYIIAKMLKSKGNKSNLLDNNNPYEI